jgi:DNA recombination-dependent growth factor C
MGALRGNASYMRFSVLGDPPRDFAMIYEQGVEARRFLPLSAEGDEMESAGWASIVEPYDEDLPLTRHDFVFDNRIALCFREDKFTFPAAYVRAQVAKKARVLEEKEDRPLKARDYKLLKEAVQGELRRKTLPRTKVVEMVWDLDRGEVRVFGSGKVVTERFAALFERTFGAQLEMANFAQRAYAVDLAARSRDLLEGLSPQMIF